MRISELFLQPRHVGHFEQLWLLSMALSVLLTIMMYDYLIDDFGRKRVALVEIALYATAGLLGVWTSRRRSNTARWLIVLFSLMMFAVYLACRDDIIDQGPAIFIAFAQVVAQVAAIHFLFTRTSRLWFAGHHVPVEDEEPDQEDY